MKTKLFLLGFMGSLCLLQAQDADVPRELSKTFNRYSRAWVQGDWGRVYDVTAPEFQKMFLNSFGSREAWIKHQAESFKDTITELERTASYRISDTLYTFATVTRGKRPGGKPFTVEGFATFELINDKWYLVEPVVPKRAETRPSSQQPQPNSKLPTR